MDMTPLNLGMIAAYYYINYTTIGQCPHRVVWEWRVLFIESNIVSRVVYAYCGVIITWRWLHNYVDILNIWYSRLIQEQNP